MQKMTRKMLKPRVKKFFLSKRPNLRNWPVVSTTQFVSLPKLMDTALQKFQFKPKMKKLKKSLKKILTIEKETRKINDCDFSKIVQLFHSTFSSINPNEILS